MLSYLPARDSDQHGRPAWQQVGDLDVAVQSGVQERPGQAGWSTGHCSHKGRIGLDESHVGPRFGWRQQVKSLRRMGMEWQRSHTAWKVYQA